MTTVFKVLINKNNTHTPSGYEILGSELEHMRGQTALLRGQTALLKFEVYVHDYTLCLEIAIRANFFDPWIYD